MTSDTGMIARLDPELVEPLEAFVEFTGGGLDLSDIPAARIALDNMFSALAAELDQIEGVTCEVRSVLGANDTPDIPVRVYRPTVASGALPCLLWIHGGGHVLGSAEQDDAIAMHLSAAAGCVVVSVDYRLAPEHPFPAPLEDCYAVLKWVATGCDELDVDPSRIAIGGASAGGGLAAGLALLARDRGEVDVVLQLLIYPMIDDRSVAPASDVVHDTLVWNRENNRLGWMAYLGPLYGSDDVSVYAAPFRAGDLTGLPATYIPVGELDLFLNENIAYARRLIEAGVPTEFHIYRGGYHGFDGIGPDADVSRRFVRDRDDALARAFE